MQPTLFGHKAMDKTFRSLLLVPADSTAHLARAAESGADVLIIDLDDMVAPDHKAAARMAALACLSDLTDKPNAPQLWVRVNGLASGMIDDDLRMIMAAAPRAIMLPEARNGADLQHLGAKLAVHEAEYNLPDGATRIVPLVTDTGASIFGLSTYAGCSPRLLALAWGTDKLAADMGANDPRTDNANWPAPFALARNLTLFAAASAGVPAIDTICSKIGDDASLRQEAIRAKADGFGAKLARHCDQIAPINQIFTP